MDLWQLHIFVSVVENKSFSKASLAINLSQPTVSNHIKELEEHFECRLLDRLGKTTELTQSGRILYQYAKQLLSLREAAESAMHDFLGRNKGDLFFGASTIPSGYILPKIIGPFSNAYPDIHVHLISGDTMQIVSEVKNGNLEFGLVGAEIDDPLIVQEKLITDEMKLILPSDHSWAGLESINCEKLFDAPFIAREKGSGTWQSIMESLKSAGFDPERLNIRINMGNTISVIQGILNRAGISILSTIAVQDEINNKRLTALSVNGLDLNRYFYLTLPARRVLSPISKKFIEFTRKMLE